MPVMNTCARAVRGVWSEVEDYLDSTARFLEGAKWIAKGFGQRGINFIRSMGPGGEELARQVEGVFRPAQRRAGKQTVAVEQALRGLSKADREAAAKVADGELARTAVSDKVAAAADVMRERLDADMNAANLVGMRRRLPDGQLAPIKGSGRAFPTRLNREGRKLVQLAYDAGKSNGRVAAFLERLVEEGRYPDVDTALQRLREYHDTRLRGTNHYFESVRFDFPEEYRVWDPHQVLPEQFRKNALVLEGVRRWGPEFDGVRPMLGRISRHGRYGRKLAEVAEKFVQAHFGVAGLTYPWHSDVANALSSYETVSKLSGIFSPILQIGQRYVMTVDAPLWAQARVVREFPPILNNWMKSAQVIRDRVAETGAVSGFNPITELTAGDRTAGSKVVRALLSPFVAAAKGNEYTSALLAGYSIQHDVEALARVRGRDTALGKFVEILRNGALDPRGMLERRIENRGIDPAEALKAWSRGERVTPEQVIAVMQKATEEEQFVLNAMTEPIFWQTQPWLRLAYKFKPFGIRAMEYTYRHVVKEAMLGNPTPFLKMFVAAAVMGEVYHETRDLLKGEDRSVLSLLRQRDPSKRDASELAVRIAGNVVDQGMLGALSEMTWGLENYVGGPALATGRNVIELVGNLSADPRQAGVAAKAFLEDEVVLTRQVEALLTQSAERVNEDTARFRSYWRFQNAARQWADAGKNQSLGGAAAAGWQRVLHGPQEYQGTTRTLRFRYAARAITASDPEKAEDYLTSLFSSQAKDLRDLDALETAARASMRANAPLGRLNEKDRRSFLSLLSPDDRRAANRLRRDWINDYERAIRKARARARRTVRSR